MFKYFLGLTVLLSLVEPANALNDRDGLRLTKLKLTPYKLMLKEGKTTKIAKDITLKVNQDLFTKGIVLKAKTYGKYYAKLDVSNLFDLRYHSKLQETFSSYQKRRSIVTGGLKVGHVVSKESKFFLRVGFESKNLSMSNALKTPHLTPASRGYWKTAIDSGVGIEHTVANNFFLTGEVRARVPANFIRPEGTDVRKGIFRLALKYSAGEK